MAKATNDDGLMQAVKLLSGRRPAKRTAGDPRVVDIGELFLAELQARRQRLQEWLRIINAEAGGTPSGPGAAARTCGAARRCRARRTIGRRAGMAS